MSRRVDRLDRDHAVSGQVKTQPGGEAGVSETPKRLGHGLEDDTAPDVMDDDKKRFRFFLGFVSIALLAVTLMFGSPASKNDLDAVLRGVATGISPGTRMVSADPKMQATDRTVTIAEEGGGPLELSIWDFADEDGDYVQVFVDGKPQTDPFAVTQRAVKVKVPSSGLIQVKGIRDGNNDGISYAVFFNKTGETHFNIAPQGGMNTYTIKTAK